MKPRGIVIIAALCTCSWVAGEPGAPVRAELNGLQLVIDPNSGGLLELECDGMKMLQARPGSASLLDAAYPGYGFDPLRLGTRYSRDARVEIADGGISITWQALGMSRAFEPKESVRATMQIRAAADGRSVTLKASIENKSELTIPQVLFPDLAGLRPFAGSETTELRTCGGVQKPFRDLVLPEDEGRWYAGRRNGLTLKSGAYDKSMAARWLDLGSLKGGFSLFPKLWSWGPVTECGEPTSDRVLLHLSQVDQTLRLMCEHKALIRPGEKWSSPEYVLTPHRHGWAKGIEPFRDWVKENVQRPHPLPKHLRRTLGYPAAVSASSMRLVYREGVCHPDLEGFEPGLLDHYAALCARFGVAMDDENISTEKYLGLMRRLHAGLKAVHLDNDFWRVIVLPESNGKVVEMTYKPTGRNVARAPRAFNRFRHEEWVRQGDGPTAENILIFEAQTEPQKVRLNLTTKDGARLQRTIALTGDAVRFETTMTADAPRGFDFLVHPEYDTATMSVDPAVLAIYVKQPGWTHANRQWREALPTDQQLAVIKNAVGGGAFAYFNHQAKFGVEQRFDPKVFGALRLFWNPSRQQINLEMISQTVPLEKGQQAHYAYEVRYLKEAPQESMPPKARTTRPSNA